PRNRCCSASAASAGSPSGTATNAPPMRPTPAPSRTSSATSPSAVDGRRRLRCSPGCRRKAMKPVIALGAAALLAACAPVMAQTGPQSPPAASRNADDPALAAVLADYEAYLKSINPLAAARDGDKAA